MIATRARKRHTGDCQYHCPAHDKRSCPHSPRHLSRQSFILRSGVQADRAEEIRAKSKYGSDAEYYRSLNKQSQILNGGGVKGPSVP